MISAAVPLNEDARLKDLHSYDILDTETDKDFDDLLEIASLIYKCPISAISFIDKNRQWIKSGKGLRVSEAPRVFSFCAHTILENNALVVNDVFKDDRFANNLAAQELNIRFYAGVPVISQNGYNIGAICIADNSPKDLALEETAVLTILSKQISRLLELKKINKLLIKQMDQQSIKEKKLLSKTIQKHEHEKINIRSLLHENIAQNLAATNYYLELAKESKSKHDLIEESKKTIDSVVKQILQLSTNITPATISNLSIKDLVEDQLSSFRKKHPLEIEFQFIGNELVDISISNCIYRTIEEQLDNIIRHANATSIIVSLEVTEQMVNLSVKDDGKGFKYENFTKGSGLNEVLSRVENLEGHAEIRSEIEVGSELTVRIPIRKNNTIPDEIT